MKVEAWTLDAPELEENINATFEDHWNKKNI